MKAALFNDIGEPGDIEIRDIGVPHPAAGQALVRVHSTAINPIDWKVASGVRKDIFPVCFPWVPGWDMSGVVEEVAAGVTEVKSGDAVFGFIRGATGQIRNGGYAEFCTVDEALLVAKPDALSHAQAACLPLAGLTAWQGLVDQLKLQSGETILVRGGAGGVGSYVIQFAKHLGATVIASASAKNKEYLESLGADSVIDYTSEDVVAEAVRISPGGVDASYDCIGQNDVDAHLGAVKAGGRVVTIAGGPSPEAIEAHKLSFGARFIAHPAPAQLGEITALVEQGSVRLPEIEEVPLEAVADALTRSKAGHVRGKLVLKVAD
jgi:NADPH2:quinone reductase